MSPRFLIAVLALPAALFVVAPAAAESSSGTVVLMPLENFSGVHDAEHEVTALLSAAISAKGWRVISDDDVETQLEADRVRYLDSLDAAVRDRIVERTGAAAILSTAVYSYIEGRNATVSIEARMVNADGTAAWGDVVAMSADETEQLFGFGRKTTAKQVAERAVATMMQHFPPPGRTARPDHAPSKPVFKAGPMSFRASDFDSSVPHLICILPFDNPSGAPEATRVVADILALRLVAASGFKIVEPAVLRAAALKARVGTLRAAGADELKRLAPLIGTTLFIRGTIYTFGEPAGRSAANTPELQIELSLVDIQAGRVLWASHHVRKGTDYIGFLMRGEVSNPVALSDRMISEMIEAESRARKAPGAAASARGTPRIPEKHSRLRKQSNSGDDR